MCDTFLPFVEPPCLHMSQNSCTNGLVKYMSLTMGHPNQPKKWCIIILFTHVHVTCVVSPNSLIYPTILSIDLYRFMQIFTISQPIKHMSSKRSPHRHLLGNNSASPTRSFCREATSTLSPPRERADSPAAFAWVSVGYGSFHGFLFNHLEVQIW